ncbi:nucleotidyltransferase family protein [Siphonobacter aquaeclarae]|uniref:cGAS/DncV-like nucleotidyltransferase C-terminal helical domain-containing protein n=1 Tax=Siphonobacter aquaeclarae TaxID=563176 RepID=A0A1G9I8P8_9BACT|nr:hypothetical protein [Siphonobacter aquaeclarae]SDL21204.1 hypothetical protein SAMN04488090_0367 [Siphonobacter aquaeclarae]
MAILNYTNRLENLRNRKFDPNLNELYTSKYFNRLGLPDNVKYLLEITQPIDKLSNDKYLLAAERVQNHLERRLNLHFERDYRHQGSITTNTNIRVHSDIDLLTIISRYHFVPNGEPILSPYTATNANEDIKLLRKQATQILKSIYQDVDDSGKKSISIFNKDLHRKVDIVFCFWYHSSTATDNEKGIMLFDFENETRIKDFPFAHISAVNTKGNSTSDGSKKGIRMLKNLKADADIELNSFQLTSIVHDISNNNLPHSVGTELYLAQNISYHLEKIISDSQYRKDIQSPNGREYPLKNDDCVEQLKKLRSELDTLIMDSQRELSKVEVRNLIHSI